jgi:hypothetical protein
MKKPSKSIEEKIKAAAPDFVSEVLGLSVQDLDTRVLNLAKEIEAIQVAKEADEEFQAAKELVREMAAPYNESKRGAQLRIKYLIQLIKEKGGVA